MAAGTSRLLPSDIRLSPECRTSRLLDPVRGQARPRTRVQPGAGPYPEIDVVIDRQDRIFWCYLRPDGVPSFTPGILRDLAEMQRSMRRMFKDSAEPPLRYFVVASRLPGVFSMGGDLGFLADRIRSGDRTAVANYARACIEVVYNNAMALDLPIVTIALVQGAALGGGFEAALSCNVIIAERHVNLGLPEIHFNLFPGMGAYSFLSRRLDSARAERMILRGTAYTAPELFEMGLVDVLAEPGQGERAVRRYIAQDARRHGVERSIYDVRQRINPLTFEELQDVSAIWVEAAMRLEEADLRKMERLRAAQQRRVAAAGANGAAAAGR